MPPGVLSIFCDFRKQEISSDPRRTWTYSTTEPCPGMWTSLATDGKHTISLNFTGYLNLSILIENWPFDSLEFRTGVSVYGYADPSVAPWLFQIDDGTPEALSVLANLPCRVVKDLQGLPNGNHRVTVTPQSINFVFTMFKYVSFNSSFMTLFIYSLSVT